MPCVPSRRAIPEQYYLAGAGTQAVRLEQDSATDDFLPPTVWYLFMVLPILRPPVSAACLNSMSYNI